MEKPFLGSVQKSELLSAVVPTCCCEYSLFESNKNAVFLYPRVVFVIAVPKGNQIGKYTMCIGT